MLEPVQERLRNALTLLKEAVDLSVGLFVQGADKTQIGAEWSAFLGEFFSYVKHKSRESKQNLLGWIRWPRL